MVVKLVKTSNRVIVLNEDSLVCFVHSCFARYHALFMTFRGQLTQRLVLSIHTKINWMCRNGDIIVR